MPDTRKLYQIARVDLPASRAGLSLMSRAGWWVHKDGRIGKKRDRRATFADKPALKLAT